MAWTRPTLSQLVARTEADFASRLTGAGTLLRRSMALVLSRTVAGAAHLLHGHLEFLGRQLFPDSSEAAYLVRQASVYGMAQLPPTYAHATATVTGSGTVVASTVLTRADGSEYRVDADVTVSGSGLVALTAAVEGSAGTLAPGDRLSFQSPVLGIDSTAIVVENTADGSDQETPDALRLRLIERIGTPAHGGSVADYVAWAKSVTGVTRVWVVPRGLGPGTVLVRFVRDDDASPIPDSGEVAAVQAVLDTNKPATATVTVAAPVAHAVNFTLSVVPNTAAVRAAAQAELMDAIRAQGAPGVTVLLSALRTAVGQADGLTDYTMTSPSADVVLAANAIPTMGTVTWA